MRGALALLIFLMSTLHCTEFLGGDSRVLLLVEECILPLSSEIVGCCGRHCCLGLLTSLEGDLMVPVYGSGCWFCTILLTVQGSQLPAWHLGFEPRL